MDLIFSRTKRLIGQEAFDRLQAAHVAVFGLGGVGSYVAEALARSGIGALTLIDSDRVEQSNINRQLIALQSTVGRYKTEVARDRIKDINPACRVNIVTGMYLPENRDEFLSDEFTYIADAIDNVTAKLDLAVEAKKRKIPIISSMGTGNKLCPELFEVADIYETSVCPLCRVIRRELKKRGVEALKVVYSKEEPLSVPPQGDDSRRSVPASIAFVPSSAGLLIAAEIIKDIGLRQQ